MHRVEIFEPWYRGLRSPLPSTALGA
jgi:hypothetical protein